MKDEVADAYKKKYKNGLPNFDLSIYSLSEFKDYAVWDSDEWWDRYDFLHVKIFADKTDGLLSKICTEKARIPPNEKNAYIQKKLGAYINNFYRSVKAHKKKKLNAAILKAAESVPFLLDAVFALHNRPTPFLDYLEDELQTYPLEKLPWNPIEFHKKIIEIVSTGSLAVQQEVAKTMEKWARNEGYGNVFDEWEGKDRWAMEYNQGQ